VPSGHWPASSNGRAGRPAGLAAVAAQGDAGSPRACITAVPSGHWPASSNGRGRPAGSA